MSRENNPLSRTDFAYLLAALLRDAGESRRLAYISSQFALESEGIGLRLENAYREFMSASPSGRNHVLHKWVNTWLALEAPPNSFVEVRNRLLPVIDRRGVHACAALNAQVHEQSFTPVPHQIVGEHYAVQLAYGQGDQRIGLPVHSLREWGITFEEAMVIARDNLASITHGGLREISPGLWISTWHDACDDVRVILTDRIRQHAVSGDHVVAIPNEDTLIVTGSLDIDGLRELASMTTAASGRPRFTSGIALRLAGDTWVPFLPLPDHPLYGQFRSLWSNSLAAEYGWQCDLLQRLYTAQDDDCLVSGTCSADDPAMGTLCVWEKDRQQLLPETRFVAFGGLAADPELYFGFAEWPVLREVAGNLMEPLGIYPERYRVRDFPSVGQLRALHLTSEVRIADHDLHSANPHVAPGIQRRPR